VPRGTAPARRRRASRPERPARITRAPPPAVTMPTRDVHGQRGPHPAVPSSMLGLNSNGPNQPHQQEREDERPTRGARTAADARGLGSTREYQATTSSPPGAVRAANRAVLRPSTTRAPERTEGEQAAIRSNAEPVGEGTSARKICPALPHREQRQKRDGVRWSSTAGLGRLGRGIRDRSNTDSWCPEAGNTAVARFPDTTRGEFDQEWPSRRTIEMRLRNSGRTIRPEGRTAPENGMVRAVNGGPRTTRRKTRSRPVNKASRADEVTEVRWSRGSSLCGE